MKGIRFTILFICLLQLLVLPLHAQKYSNEFLSIGIGGAAQGAGNAVVASVRDVTAAYWNPAGLAAAEEVRLELAAMHTEWFAGIGKFDYLGLRMPLNSPGKNIAVTLLRFGVDNIPNTLTLYERDGSINYDNLSSFSAADYAFLFSYGQELSRFKQGLRVGANLKIIHRIIGPFASSWGFGLDAGLQWERNNWQLGLVVRDLSNTFNAWRFSFNESEKDALQITGNQIPINSLELTRPSIVLGLSHQFNWGQYGLQPEFNWIIYTDGTRNTFWSRGTFSFDPLLGIEGHYKKLAFLRFGFNQLQKEQVFGSPQWTVRPAMGVGIHPGSIAIDYAFTDPGGTQAGTYSHIISVKISLKD